MVCKHCNSENITKGIYFGNSDPFRPMGPRYRESIVISYGVQTYCDLCEDCGEIQRLYVIPPKGGKWITHDVDVDKLKAKRLKEEATKEELELINKEVEKYSQALIAKEYDKTYVKDLDNFVKHDWYEFPVKTKGPSYRLYIDKLTQETVLIKPTTMNRDKGNYVVCYKKPTFEPEEDIYSF